LRVKVPFLDLGRQVRRLRPQIDQAVARVLDSGRFILGPELESFEQELAATFGATTAVGVANGTQALELLLRARGIGPGDEVIVPALTSPFTALAVVAAGATPVFADIDPDTALLDVDSAREVKTGRTRAVIPVHLYGRVMPLEHLETLGLPIFQDASHAHGAALRFDHPAAFSLYPTKNLGGLGDAGAILTGDEKLALKLRRLRHGGQRQYAVVTDPGTNSRLDEIQAAILRIFLAELPANNRRRRELAARYAEAALPLGGWPEHPADHVFHLYVIRRNDREALRERLSAAGIETAVHYPVPLHQQPLFRPRVPFHLPCAEKACEEILSLPLNPDLSDAEAGAVLEALRA
jgi:dTDP-3-amino-3,4,6-trideoxy-alpha-D-glucose transaminase